MTTTTGGAAERPGLAGGVAADRVARAGRATAPRSPSSGPRSPSSARSPARSSPRSPRTLDVGQRGVPVHDLPGDHPRLRHPGPGLPDLLLRRAGLRGQRVRLVRAAGLGGHLRRRRRSSASPRTAPRPCTCCAPRRATRSSARTPTAPSPRRTPAWSGSCPRSRTSSASGPTPAPTPPAPTASTWWRCCRSTARCGCPEGTQLIGAHGVAVNAGIQPVPMLGHVTSSYHSAALGRSFALALIKNGRDLHRPDPDGRRSATSWSTSSSPKPSSTTPKGTAAMAETAATDSSDASPGRLRPVSPAAHLAERFAAAEVTGPRAVGSARCRS